MWKKSALSIFVKLLSEISKELSTLQDKHSKLPESKSE